MMRELIIKASFKPAFFILLFLLAQGAHSQSDAASAAAPGLFALADFFVDGVPGGTIEFYTDSFGRPLIPAITLRRILEPIVKPSLMDQVVGGRRFVTEEDLLLIGVRLVYVQSDLSLRFTTTPRSMITKDLRVRGVREQSPGGTLFPAEPFSAMLGTSIRIDPSYDFSPGTGPAVNGELGLDPSVRLFGFVAEGGIDIGYSASPWVRLREALLSYDFPGFGARAALGIIDSRPVSFQGASDLVGFSFFREASLPGGKRIRPPLIDEILLDRNADIAVEINGIVTRRLRLPPGSYRLSDLPLSAGFNAVTVRILEDGKPQRLLELGLSFDGAILPVGEKEYAFSLGFNRADMKSPFSFTSISVGVTPRLELGFDIAAGLGGVLSGTSMLWASPVGSLGASGAVSYGFTDITNPKAGYAGRLDWRLALPGYRYIPRLGAGVEYRSKDFSPPQDAEAETKTEILRLSSQLSQTLPGGFGSLGTFANAGFAAGALQDFSLSIGFFFPVSVSVSITVSVGADWSIDRGMESRAVLSLTVIPEDRRTLQYRQDIVTGNQSFELHFPLDDKERFSLTAGGDGNYADAAQARETRLSSTYLGDFAELTASAAYSTDPPLGVKAARFSFAASSAAAYAGGHFGVSRSLGDAFLILVPHKSLGQDTLVLRPDNGPAIVSEDGKDRLVSALRAYKPFSATVDMPESPPDRGPRPQTVRIEPSYRSGTIVEIRAAPSSAFRGRLVDGKGRALHGRIGKVFRAEAESIQIGRTFTDDEGTFECYGVEKGEYIVAWADGGRNRVFVA
ncbi:MAG: hypothetical protein WCT14_18560, partial [Treponemataceae bacterium]